MSDRVDMAEATTDHLGHAKRRRTGDGSKTFEDGPVDIGGLRHRARTSSLDSERTSPPVGPGECHAITF